MKPYVVVVYVPNQMYDFNIPNMRATGWRSETHATSGKDWNSSESVLFWVENEESGIALAQHLAGKYSGVEYCVAKTDLLFISKPGPVKISKMTEKGLLPL